MSRNVETVNPQSPRGAAGSPSRGGLGRPRWVRRSADSGNRWAALWITGIVLLLALIWQGSAAVGLVNKRFASDPAAVIASLGGLFSDGQAMTAIVDTLVAVVISFVIGSAAGVVFGFVLGTRPLLREAYFPMVRVLMGIPTVVFLPLFVLFLGLGIGAAIGFASLLAFVQVVVNVVAGIDLVEPKYYIVARAFQASSWRLFIDVLLAGASPGIFAGLYHGLRNSFVGVIIAQLYISAAGGVGFLVYLWTNNFQIDQAMALILLVGGIVIVIGSSWKALEARLTAWRRV